MDSLSILFLVGGILAAVFIPLIVGFGFIIWWLRRHKAALTKAWLREGVVFLRGPTGANVSGLESQGMVQVRGNGVIALTGDDLRITRAAPSAEWRIPFDQIKEVTLESSFLGKRRSMQVLVITFAEDGQPADRIGVYVRQPQAWLEAIKQMAK